tara:strand:+ start:2991 stop:3149 length:159 start_codon:yes stop_codon:yes gene_type:complete
MGDIEGALAAIDSLKLGESINYAATAEKKGVNRSPLSRRQPRGSEDLCGENC